MEIKRELVMKAVDENGKELVVGKRYTFDVEEGKCLTGVYTGITKRGALSFESVLSGSLVAFNVMPKSILKIREEE